MLTVPLLMPKVLGIFFIASRWFFITNLCIFTTFSAPDQSSLLFCSCPSENRLNHQLNIAWLIISFPWTSFSFLKFPFGFNAEFDRTTIIKCYLVYGVTSRCQAIMLNWAQSHTHKNREYQPSLKFLRHYLFPHCQYWCHHCCNTSASSINAGSMFL